MLFFPLLATTASLLHLATAAPTPFVNDLASTLDEAVAPLVDAIPAPLDNTVDSPFAALEKRQTCRTASTCKNKLTVVGSGRACVSGVCTWSCKKGYTRSGNQCNLNTSVKTTSRVATSNVQLAAVSSSNLSGVKSFLGLNTGAIASWYHTNSAQDSTNGNSWCYYPYRDSTPGFAISLGAMLADAGGDATRAREMYCGLEAVVTTPSGKTLTLYVADAFDDAWVRTPTSMDVIYNSFSNLFGKSTSNKNDVIQNVSWQFTGGKSAQYSYRGAGN